MVVELVAGFATRTEFDLEMGMADSVQRILEELGGKVYLMRLALLEV